MIFLFLFVSFSFSSFEKVSIGKIDPYYKTRVTKEQLLDILREIKDNFEKKLNRNIFEYSEDGKPIDFVHLASSKLEDRISSQMKKIDEKEEQIEKFKIFFPLKKDEIDNLKASLKDEKKELDIKLKSFEAYIKEINAKKKITKVEYEEAKQYTKDEKNRLKKEIAVFNNNQKKLNKVIKSFNIAAVKYNSLVSEYNRLKVQLESMNRNYTKVQGRTIGFQKTQKESSYKEGKKVETKRVQTTMNKIEIYGFKNLAELKIILAHEIAHLVGLPHTLAKGALMNPLIQNKQLENGLFLTPDDIYLFNKYFE